MLAALQSFNVQPGPQLFEDQSTLVWTLIASLLGVYSLSGSGYEVLMACRSAWSAASCGGWIPDRAGRIVARIRGTQPARDRLTFGEDD